MRGMLGWALVLILAAVGPDRAAAAPSKVALRVFCTAYADNLKSVHVRTGPRSFEEVRLSTANVVAAGEALIEEGRVVFYGAEEDGRRQPVASGEVGDVRQPLVVLGLPEEDGEMPYRCVVAEFDRDRFPLGSYQFVNLSPFKVRLEFGDETAEFECGKPSVFKPGVEPGEVTPAIFDYWDQDRWNTLSKTPWAVRDDRRSLVCVLQDPRSKRMNLKSVPLRDDLLEQR